MAQTTNEQQELHDIESGPVRFIRDTGVGLITGVEDIAVTGVHAVGDIGTAVVHEIVGFVSTALNDISAGLGSAFSTGGEAIGRFSRRTGRGSSTTTGSETSSTSHG